LTHNFLIRGAVLLAAPATFQSYASPSFFISQKLSALFGTFSRTAPENRLFVFPVEVGVFGSAFSAQDAA
jgi:hypothetical protein